MLTCILLFSFLEGNRISFLNQALSYHDLSGFRRCGEMCYNHLVAQMRTCERNPVWTHSQSTVLGELSDSYSRFRLLFFSVIVCVYVGLWVRSHFYWMPFLGRLVSTCCGFFQVLFCGQSMFIAQSENLNRSVFQLFYDWDNVPFLENPKQQHKKTSKLLAPFVNIKNSTVGFKRWP